MNIFDLDNYGISFKNLISAPAPVGRILNYIYLAGNGKLKHKNGYRYTNLENDIGSAWATEFMLGLDLVYIGIETNDSYSLELTDKGSSIYNILLQSDFVVFDEGTSISNIRKVKEQIYKVNTNLYNVYKDIFINSIPFRILKDYLFDNGFFYRDRKKFMDEYFEIIKRTYDRTPKIYNKSSRTTTAENRVPSLLQFCQLFDLLEDENGTLTFKKEVISKLTIKIAEREFNSTEMLNISKREEKVIHDIELLALKYGADGTVMINSIVRNSTLQSMFKQNLIINQGAKCVVCGMKNRELLIGSHIKPASESDVYEKVNINNGLLLCCNHDKLFDRYLITFGFMDGEIEISKSLSNEDLELLGLNKEIKLPEELLTNERREFLMEHNATFQNYEVKR